MAGLCAREKEDVVADIVGSHVRNGLWSVSRLANMLVNPPCQGVYCIGQLSEGHIAEPI